MKTVNFEVFAKDKIQENKLNFLIGGKGGADDDILVPPRK